MERREDEESEEINHGRGGAGGGVEWLALDSF